MVFQVSTWPAVLGVSDAVQGGPHQLLQLQLQWSLCKHYGVKALPLVVLCIKLTTIILFDKTI